MRAMPSPTSRTVPTSSTLRSMSKFSICLRMIALISSGLICMLESYSWTAASFRRSSFIFRSTVPSRT